MSYRVSSEDLSKAVRDSAGTPLLVLLRLWVVDQKTRKLSELQRAEDMKAVRHAQGQLMTLEALEKLLGAPAP